MQNFVFVFFEISVTEDMQFASLCIGWGSSCMCAIWVCRSTKQRIIVDCTAYVAVFGSGQDFVLVVLTKYLGSTGSL